jgi:hypothetical protein
MVPPASFRPSAVGGELSRNLSWQHRVMVFTRSELEAQTNLNQPLIASRGGTRAEEASPEEALTG